MSPTEQSFSFDIEEIDTKIIVTEQEKGIDATVERPWGIYNYRYYFEPMENCEPREILPNRSAVNVIKYDKPLLGKYRELYYTNKNKLLKENVLGELELAQGIFN